MGKTRLFENVQNERIGICRMILYPTVTSWSKYVLETYFNGRVRNILSSNELITEMTGGASTNDSLLCAIQSARQKRDS